MGVADDPAERDATRCRPCLGLGDLARGAAGGRPEIAVAVPGLFEDLAIVTLVEVMEVDGVGRVVRASWTFERAASPVSTPDFQEVFLDLEMPGIDQAVFGAARPAEPDRKRLPQGNPKRDPDLQRQAHAESALDRADPRLGQPDPTTEHYLVPVKLSTTGSDGGAERRCHPPRLEVALHSRSHPSCAHHPGTMTGTARPPVNRSSIAD